MIPDAEMEKEKADSKVIELDMQTRPPVIRPEQDDFVKKVKKVAEQESKKILELANLQKERMLKQVFIDAEEIRQQARQEGYQSGQQEKAEQIEDCIRQVRDALEELKTAQLAFMESYNRELKNFALEIAAQILCKKISEDELELAELVNQAVHSVRDANWISLELSEKLPRLAAFLEEELSKKNDQAGHIDITLKDLPSDSCILETPDGLVDASVSTQLSNLKEYFNQIEQDWGTL